MDIRAALSNAHFRRRAKLEIFGIKENESLEGVTEAVLSSENDLIHLDTIYDRILVPKQK